MKISLGQYGFTGYGQFIGLSVAEDLAFALKMTWWSKRERACLRAKAALRFDEALDHRPQDLSGGQKQRVTRKSDLCSLMSHWLI